MGALALGLSQICPAELPGMVPPDHPLLRLAKEFYDRKRQAGLGHHAAVRALAFKWQRILFRCWMDRQPYLESRYLEALAKSSRRQAAPSAGSAQRPKIVMKSCGRLYQVEGVDLLTRHQMSFRRPAFQQVCLC
jgi:hypothetical protein